MLGIDIVTSPQNKPPTRKKCGPKRRGPDKLCLICQASFYVRPDMASQETCSYECRNKLRQQRGWNNRYPGYTRTQLCDEIDRLNTEPEAIKQKIQSEVTQ